MPSSVNKSGTAQIYADLVLFDPDAIVDRATFENPELPSTGIDSVMVNGAFTFTQDQATAARSGQLLLN